jgi:hypothetical protein
MAGCPGNGCDDPRETHPHWCGFCGARQMFTALECTQLMSVPLCPRCGGTDWRDEIAELTSPENRPEGSA